MNLKRFTYTALAFFAALVLAACDGVSDFGDMNQNPTQATSVEPGFQFSTIQLGTAGSRYEQWRVNLIYGSTIVQHLAPPLSYWAGNFYTYNEDYATSFWRVAYAGDGVSWRAPVKNIQDLIARLEQMQEEGEPVANKLAAARIWRTVIFHRVTDVYGDTPYFQGGKGFSDGVSSPRYTSQDSIYYDMLNELTEAVDQFDPEQPTYEGSDLVFGGDIGKWQRFGNSLRMRLALRLVKVDPQRARSEFEAAANASGGYMMSNDDTAYIVHASGPSTGPAGVNTNANSEAFTFGGGTLSQTMVDWMQATGDPRLSAMGIVSYEDDDGNTVSTDDPADQVGHPNGYTASTIEDHPSWVPCEPEGSPPEPCGSAVYTQLKSYFQDLDDPVFFQTYAEVAFMLAEAAARGWAVPGNATTHYENGVRAAMAYLTFYDDAAAIDEADVDAYLTANPYPGGGTLEAQLEQINTQYWAATFLNSYEAWANWRRTGYPDLDPSPVDDPDPYPGNVTSGAIPSRLPYPNGESVINADNYNEAVARQGIATDRPDLTTPVWWDCNDQHEASTGTCNTAGLGAQADPQNRGS